MNRIIDIEGVDELLKNISAYQVRKYTQARRALDETAINVERKGKRNAPVDTGRLMNSIHVVRPDPRPLTRDVIADTDYAVYQEFGTRYYPGKQVDQGRGKLYMTRAKDSEKIPLITRLKQVFGTD